MSDDEWEAEFDREVAEEAKQKAAAAARVDVLSEPAQHVAKSKKSVVPQQPSYPGTAQPASSTILEERLRIEREVEEAERRLCGDLLSGCDLTESASELLKEASAVVEQAPIAGQQYGLGRSGGAGLDGLSLKNISDATKLGHLIGSKIETSPARSAAWLELLTIILGYCSPKMEPKDLKTLADKAAQASTRAGVERRVQLQSKKKVNDDVRHKVSYFKEEYDMVFGDSKDKYDYSEEDDDDDDDDDFMR